MNKTLAPPKHTKPPQNTTTSRVLKLTFKGIEPVDRATWKRIEAAARVPRMVRRYPELIEAPDTD